MSEISRRTTMQWVLAAAASPLLAACGDSSGWRDANVRPVDGTGYGTDPNLMTPPETPWPLTLTEPQRETVRAAADVILPGARAAQVDAFIDEWISAPYERQQGDRELIVSGLNWLDRESRKRFDQNFASASAEQHAAIFDDIAFKERVKEGFDKPAEFFRRLRSLTLAGYYTMPEGIAEIGYLGNSPIMGPYPGPSAEALDHLRGQLASLNLTMPPLSGSRTRR